MGTHKKRLGKALLMNTHNIPFCGEINFNIYGLKKVPYLNPHVEKNRNLNHFVRDLVFKVLT